MTLPTEATKGRPQAVWICGLFPNYSSEPERDSAAGKGPETESEKRFCFAQNHVSLWDEIFMFRRNLV